MSRSVVVTGCGTGLGRAILERLTADGWATVGIEWDVTRAAEARAAPGVGDVVTGDAADREVLAAAAARATALAPLGAWVNNAAIVRMGTLHDPHADEVDETIRVNLMGAFWGCSEAVKVLLAQRTSGAIVNISSIHARAAFNGFAAYDVAKGGINALTCHVAVEYGPAGIRCNAIEPGAFRTPTNQSVIDGAPDPAKVEWEMAALYPLGRMGEPREIGSVTAILLSDEASFLSGECIAVDGAATARCFPYDPDPTILG